MTLPALWAVALCGLSPCSDAVRWIARRTVVEAWAELPDEYREWLSSSGYGDGSGSGYGDGSGSGYGYGYGDGDGDGDGSGSGSGYGYGYGYGYGDGDGYGDGSGSGSGGLDPRTTITHAGVMYGRSDMTRLLSELLSEKGP